MEIVWLNRADCSAQKLHPLHLAPGHVGNLGLHIPDPGGVTQLLKFCPTGGKGDILSSTCHYAVPSKLLSMCLFRSLVSYPENYPSCFAGVSVQFFCLVDEQEVLFVLDLSLLLV